MERPPADDLERLLERGIRPSLALAGVGARGLAKVFQKRMDEFAVRNLRRARPPRPATPLAARKRIRHEVG